MIAQDGIRGGMSPWLSKPEVRRYALPSRTTFADHSMDKDKYKKGTV